VSGRVIPNRATKQTRKPQYSFATAGEATWRVVGADEFALCAENCSLQRKEVDLMRGNSSRHRASFLRKRRRTPRL